MDKEQYPIKKLSRNKFTDALQKGLGRAYLHAIRYGIDEVADLVLKACLHDQAFDAQSESSKAEYLFGMFRNTRYLTQFKEAILKVLKTKRNTWDIQLLFEITLQMAKTGDPQARVSIRDRALKKAGINSDDDWLGATEWITLAGVDGAIELAEIYGSRLLKNPDDFIPEDEIFPNEEMKNTFRKMLLEKSPKNRALTAYRNYLDRRKGFKPRNSPATSKEILQLRQKQEIRKRFNLKSILQDALNRIDTYGVRFHQFGWAATPEELQIVYTRLLKETDNDIIWRLLAVFGRVPLPGLDDQVFLWANSTDNQVRWSAIHALAQNRDDKVHQLALKKIKTGKLAGADSGCIELFINNYTRGDAELIADALYRIRPNKEDAHSLAYDIIGLSKKHQDSGLVKASKWAYEKTPCSDCRYHVVKQLNLLGHFSGEILYECQFDGNKDIAELARQKLNFTNQ